MARPTLVQTTPACVLHVVAMAMPRMKTVLALTQSLPYQVLCLLPILLLVLLLELEVVQWEPLLHHLPACPISSSCNSYNTNLWEEVL